MAMYITFKNGRERLWHIGSPTPTTDQEVVEVQADGDELEYVINRFKNIPYPSHQRVVKWHGDLAKLIANNL